LNSRPQAYESCALTTELPCHGGIWLTTAVNITRFASVDQDLLANFKLGCYNVISV
jgi:hypothetical protein